MQYSKEHLKTMVYAKFGGQTECIMGNWKIENVPVLTLRSIYIEIVTGLDAVPSQTGQFAWLLAPRASQNDVFFQSISQRTLPEAIEWFLKQAVWAQLSENPPWLPSCLQITLGSTIAINPEYETKSRKPNTEFVKEGSKCFFFLRKKKYINYKLWSMKYIFRQE